MKEMERTLGLSYPTVRARLEEALTAAGLDRDEPLAPMTRPELELPRRRAAILASLEHGEISPGEAADRLRDLQEGKAG